MTDLPRFETPAVYVASGIMRRPFGAHQLEAFLRSADAETVPPRAEGGAGADVYALFMEQRTRKSKVIVDTAAYRFLRGDVTALLVIAMPTGVPVDWAEEHVPKDLPDCVPRRCFVWRTGRAHTKTHAAEADALLKYGGLVVLSASADALRTTAFRKYLARFLKARGRVMAVADETTLIMLHADGKATRIMRALGKRPEVVAKRILDGTPTGNGGPLDLYAQCAFLDPEILGHSEYLSYKNHFAEWEQRVRHSDGRAYPVLKKYRNLDEIARRLAPYSYRCTRRECFPDAPEKTYRRVRFELTDEQRRVYKDLKEKYAAELGDGRVVTARLVIARYVRLQQVTSNYMPGQEVARPCEACDATLADPSALLPPCEACDGAGFVLEVTPGTVIDARRNPRLEALEETLRDREPAIVWSRYRRERDEIVDLGRRMGMNPVRYDGTVDDEAKAAAKRDFQSGAAGWFVGSARSVGRGARLSRAEQMVYFSNTFSYLDRAQSEDRAEDERATSLGVNDIVAEGTVDDRIVEVLRSARSMHETITGDPRRDWI